MVYIVVTGFPGAGKSSVASPLARSLNLPLFAKDTVKEALASVQAEVDVTLSRQLGAAAFEVVFALAADAQGAVLEASWDPRLAEHRLAGLPGALLEVHCACPAELTRQRYVARAPERHPVHHDAARFEDVDLWSHHAYPLRLSEPVIEVDCTTPLDITMVVGEVRSHPSWM